MMIRPSEPPETVDEYLHDLDMDKLVKEWHRVDEVDCWPSHSYRTAVHAEIEDRLTDMRYTMQEREDFWEDI